MLLALLVLGAGELLSQVSGVVTSSDSGETLIGVSIVKEGTSSGTISDIDGSYSVEAEEGDVLIFSYTGFSDQKITVGPERVINVALDTESALLDEIVVVGYGAMKKSDVTGSIISVRGDALTDIRSGNVMESLQGRVAGLDISRGSGRAGSGVDLLVRGERSLRATNAPLILVDGVPYGSNIDIPTEDIESIEILKDASSTAIYGSKGANGVILITTKRGKSGKSNISVNTYYGIADPFQKVPVYDRDGYIRAKIDARRDINNWEVEPNINNAFLGDEVAGVENGVSTDWQDLISKQGSQRNLHIGFDGGTEKLTYSTSLSYYGEEGVVIQDEFERFTFRLNLDAQLNDFLKVGTSTIIANKQRNGNGPNFTNAIRMSPIVEAYDSLGNYIFQPNFANPRKSPLATVDDVREETDTRIFTTFYGQAQLLKNLTYRTNFNVDLNNGKLGYMFPQKVPDEGITTSGVDVDDNVGYLWNNILNYNLDINESNRLALTAVHEVQYDRSEFYGVAGQDQQFTRSLWYNLGTNQNVTSVSSLRETALVSFLGRANYTLNNKYIVSVSGRYDGASQLSPGNKWSFFPAASLAWRVKQEKFLIDNNLISDLKLRLGFGVTGNASIDPYSTAASLNANPLFYEFGEPGAESPAFGFRPVALASEGLQWERTSQRNIGIDFGIFNNRISGSVDVFQASTDKLLLQDQLPPTSGFDNVFVNAGETKSWGWEVFLQTVNIDKGGFKWNTVLSYFGSREEIVSLTSGLLEDEANQWFVGEPISVQYDFNKIGIWQLGEEDDPLFTGLGEIKVEDINNDGVIDFEDRKVLGTPRPDWSGSLINSFSYGGFDMTINIFARMGGLVRAGAYAYDPRMLDNMIAVDYWTPENPTNSYPRYDATRAELPFESTLQYVDGSFIKLKNVTFGYSLPKSLLSKASVQKVRVYVSGKNTAILHSKMFDGLDPERRGSISYPLARLWLFGLEVGF
ncbi:MAG: SusC/RagA family TonB-linked outer membrane protein [Lewinella sp.]